MRILRLDLLAFGPFTDQRLELHEGRYGLHIVYGPNEAGKSSALRALRQFLYGIELRSRDDFVHPYARLRIGAVLADEQGEPFHFIRRKGAKDTLLGSDDTAADPAGLHRLLGGVDHTEFCQRFGIDHQELVAGGRDMVHGGGSLGQLLFATGAGLADLNAIQSQLVRETEELFKPQGTNPRINEAVSELHRAKRARKEAQLRPAEWSGHVEALRAAESEQAELQRQLAAKNSERQRLDRLRKALPLIAKRKHLLEEREPLAGVPILPADFAERCREALVNVKTSEDVLGQSVDQIQKLESAIAALQVSEALLKHAASIQSLQEALGAHRKAIHDRPGLVAGHQRLEEEARAILRELGRDLPLEHAERLQLTRPQRVRIQELGSQRQALSEKLDDARRRVSDLGRQVADIAQQLSQREQPRDTSALQRAIRRARRAGDVSERLASALTDVQRLEQRAQAELNKLGRWSGTLSELERLPVPARESVERFESQLGELEADLKSLRQRQCELQAEANDLQAELERHHQDAVTEEDLQTARQQRDEAWALVRAAWLGESAPGERRQRLLNFGAEDLASAYEAGLERADGIADRLRRESKQVAEKARLMAVQRKNEQKAAGLAEQLQDKTLEYDRLLQQWQQLWTPLGIAPLSPREMLGWLRRQAELVRAAEEVRSRREDARQLAQQIDDLRQDLDREWANLGAGAELPCADAPLSDWLDASEDLAARWDEHREMRQRLERDLARLEQQRAAAALEAQTAEAELARWREAWAEAMRALDLSAEATLAEAHEVTSGITELLQKLSEGRSLTERIEGVDREAQQFSAQVALLTSELAPDLASAAPEPAVVELLDRWKAAQDAATRREELQGQREHEETRGLDAQRKISQHKAILDARCQEAGCTAPEQLSDIAQRSLQRQQCEARLHEIEDRLLELAAGSPLEALLNEAAGADAEALDQMVTQLDEELARLEARRTELSETIIRQQLELRRMDGSGRAAEADEEAQGLLAKIRTDAEQYVRLRLASVILQRAIERYRGKNQGPVLQRGSRIFSQLTLGSFAGLRDDYDDKGQAVLVGVRPDGRTTLGVEGMSDGTRDQLYLALRLASLEYYLEQNAPMPFIVDDILVQFDDARAAAALRVLAELSDRTQVIFFTHHEHLLEVARTHVDNGKAFFHRL